MTPSRQHCATHVTGWPCLSALRSKLRWWHTIASMADQFTRVLPRHLFTDRLRFLSFSASKFALLTTITWFNDCTTYSDRASRHPRFGTCCHLISRTLMLVANSSSRAFRLGSLCKPTHKRRLWELCLSGALQMLDLVDWLIENIVQCLYSTRNHSLFSNSARFC